MVFGYFPRDAWWKMKDNFDFRQRFERRQIADKFLNRTRSSRRFVVTVDRQIIPSFAARFLVMYRKSHPLGMFLALFVLWPCDARVRMNEAKNFSVDLLVD